MIPPKVIIADPGASTPMEQAVSIAMAILKVCRVQTWEQFATATKKEDQEVILALRTIEVTDEQRVLLAQFGPILGLLVIANRGSGEKSATIACCQGCGDWLLTLVGGKGGETCQLTPDCPGPIRAVSEARRVAPDLSLDLDDHEELEGAVAE